LLESTGHRYLKQFLYFIPCTVQQVWKIERDVHAPSCVVSSSPLKACVLNGCFLPTIIIHPTIIARIQRHYGGKVTEPRFPSNHIQSANGEDRHSSRFYWAPAANIFSFVKLK
jgi:hypothetical protein